MRTTLKRGTRGGHTNGRGPGSPVLGAYPSGPLSPQTRYEAWHRSGWRLAGKIFGWLVVTVLVAAGAFGGGIWLYLNNSVNAVQAKSKAVKDAEAFLEAPLPGQPTIAMIIGYDQRKGPEADVSGRSDTIMLLRADPSNDTLSLLSFPRDLLVEIPACHGNAPTVDRINAAYTYCGPLGTVKTVQQLTGLKSNYLIVVNFSGFKRVVNQLDGVYIDVDHRYFNDNSSGEQYATINLQPGYQKLTGGAALDYARFRHTDSDFHRSSRQQAFVKALKQQISTSFSLTKLPGIIHAITETVEVGRGGKKKIDFGTVLGYARFLYGLPAGHFFQSSIEVEQLSPADFRLQPKSGAVEKAVQDFLNPDVNAAEKATQAAGGGKPPKSATPKPSEVSMIVLNGSGVDGIANEVGVTLAERGYLVVDTGNADVYDYFNTEVRYDPAKAGAKAAAVALAKQFGDAKAISVANPDFDTMLEVVVGTTFQGSLAPITPDKTPEHAPPTVVRSYDAVLPYLRKAKKQVDFPVLVPTVIDVQSSLDTEVPVRVYTVNRHDAIRITYNGGGYGSYWGVQETTWTDAPILGDANVTKKSGGRTYRLYYDGARLHLVAFEQNGAVYWVSNTILDELSNETMLAIAKGLQPLAALK